jgi:predicted molibdopterin-dependent oxidoreductase YjgC
MVNQNGELNKADWDEALELIAEKLKAFDKKEIGALASTHATNEALKQFTDLFKEHEVDNMGCLEGAIPEPRQDEFNLADIEQADMFIVVGEDLNEDHQVVGFLIKRHLIEKDRKLVIVNEEETGLSKLAFKCLKPGEVDEVVSLSEEAENPVVIYGEKAGEELDILREKLSDKAKFFWMAPGTNSRGAAAVGLTGAFDANAAKCVYIMACETKDISEELLEKLKEADFVAVQTSYIEPWDEIADVILPSAQWAEKEGTVINLEVRTLKVAKAVEPPTNVKQDEEILSNIMEKMGYLSLEEIA